MEKQQWQVKISDEMLRGVYANMFQVAHTPEEFILDFMNIYGKQSGVVTARVILSPAHMKRISAAIKANVESYEDKFGEIQSQETPKQDFDFTVN